MTDRTEVPNPIRFGPFEVWSATQTLRKNGTRLKLPTQAIEILLILLQNPGRVTTREELKQRLWPDVSCGDFDHGLNVAVNRLREALGDSAESPRFVETLPRRGYRFIAPVESPLLKADQAPIEKPTDNAKEQRYRLRVRLAVVSAAVLVAGLLVFWIASTRTPGSPKVLRFTRLTSDGQKKIGPLVSDGVRVYFNEWLPDGRLIVVQASVKGGDVTPLAVPLNAPFVQDISTDGTELLVANDDGPQGRSVWVQPIAGGSPHRVGTVLTNWGPWGPGLDFAAFAADTTHILYSQGNDVYSVSRDGSALRKIFSVGHLTKDFRYSPDSQVLRFSQFKPFEKQTIMSASPDGTRLHKLVDGCCGGWTPDGRYFIFSSAQFYPSSDLWALPETGKFRGQKQNDAPIQLTAGPLDFGFPLPAKHGREVFAIGTAYRAEVVRYDKKRDQFVPFLPGISAEGLAFSSDGQWVAYTSYPDGDLWRSKVDGSEALQLTFPPMKVLMPRWSPDGRQIAFNATLPGGIFNIYVISSAGGTTEHLLPSDEGQLDVDWSPDGKSLVFGATVDPKRSIYMIDLSSRRVSALPGSEGFFSPHWSPDGRYISGTTLQSWNLMLFDTATQSWTKPCDCKVAYPIWSHDGRYIYFQHATEPGKGYHIVRLRPSDRKIETVADVSSVGRWTAGIVGEWFGLAPDDSPLFARDISAQEIYALEMRWP